LKYGIAFGFAGFIIALAGMFYATGMLDLRFPAVIGAGFFGGGVLGSLVRRLNKKGEERKAGFIFLCIVLIAGIPSIAEYTYDILTGNWKIWKLISIFAFAYLISYEVFCVIKSEEVKK